MTLRILVDDSAASLSPQEKAVLLLIALVQECKEENPRLSDAFIARQFGIPTSTVKAILHREKKS